MLGKDAVRSADRGEKITGRAVELLRHLDAYRAAGRIMVVPSAALRQVRVNALTDGKELLVPAPGLKEGFYLLRPYEVPFAKLNYAVGYSGILQHGRRVEAAELCREPVALLVTDCLAVDRAGYFAGDGKGLFDLAVAILAELGALAPEAEVFAMGDKSRLFDQEFTHDPWDVRLNGFITSEGILLRNSDPQTGRRIFWDSIVPRRIRKITPLWKMRGMLAGPAGEIAEPSS